MASPPRGRAGSTTERGESSNPSISPASGKGREKSNKKKKKNYWERTGVSIKGERGLIWLRLSHRKRDGEGYPTKREASKLWPIGGESSCERGGSGRADINRVHGLNSREVPLGHHQDRMGEGKKRNSCRRNAAGEMVIITM